MMKGLVFGIALAGAGVAAMAGSAMAQRVVGHGSHGGHGGAGPGWPTPSPSGGCPNVAGASCCVGVAGGDVSPAC